MLRFETTKLFYNTFKHKLVIKNNLSYIFKDKNFYNARVEIDELQYLYEENEQLFIRLHRRKVPVSTQEFFECKTLYNILQSNKEYKLRIEKPNLGIYSNDLPWLMDISSKVAEPLELWSPDPITQHKLQKNVILVDVEPAFPFKVTLGNRTKTDPSFVNWAIKNKSLIRISNKLLSKIQQDGYVAGSYFYVRDEKVLNLINLFLSSPVMRVDKLVFKEHNIR